MRYWSLLFLLTAAVCAAVFFYAPFDPNFWLTRNTSTFGRQIDHLFLMILWVTGVVFIGTQLALAYAVWSGADRKGKPAAYFHGSNKLEVVWTLIPAAILIFITAYQMGTWADMKFKSAMPGGKPLAEVTARQFQWMVRYPGPDGLLRTSDDLHTVNDLRFAKGQPVLIQLRSQDVVHSFFLPQMRIKQDAVPGWSIPVWFDADRAGNYELVCAELCGWGHYKMRGKVTVYETQEELDAWLATVETSQTADTAEEGEELPSEPPGEEEAPAATEEGQNP